MKPPTGKSPGFRRRKEFWIARFGLLRQIALSIMFGIGAVTPWIWLSRVSSPGPLARNVVGILTRWPSFILMNFTRLIFRRSSNGWPELPLDFRSSVSRISQRRVVWGVELTDRIVENGLGAIALRLWQRRQLTYIELAVCPDRLRTRWWSNFGRKARGTGSDTLRQQSVPGPAWACGTRQRRRRHTCRCFVPVTARSLQGSRYGLRLTA